MSTYCNELVNRISFLSVSLSTEFLNIRDLFYLLYDIPSLLKVILSVLKWLAIEIHGVLNSSIAAWVLFISGR